MYLEPVLTSHGGSMQITLEYHHSSKLGTLLKFLNSGRLLEFFFLSKCQLSVAGPLVCWCSIWLMRVLKILRSMSRLCYPVLEAAGKVSQPLLPPETAREALPCLSRALKYRFGAPLRFQKILFRWKSLHTSWYQMYRGFIFLVVSKLYVEFLCNICRRWNSASRLFPQNVSLLVQEQEKTVDRPGENKAQWFHQRLIRLILWNKNVKWCQDLRSEQSSRGKFSPSLNQVTAPVVRPSVNLHMSPNTLNIVQEKAIAWRRVSSTHSASGGGGWEGVQSMLNSS